LGFEFLLIVYTAEWLQLLGNGDVMQAATLVLSPEYILRARIGCIRGEHTRFAGGSGGQRRHVDDHRSALFAEADCDLRVLGGRADRRLGGSSIAATNSLRPSTTICGV
jgi:hypothetical protein